MHSVSIELTLLLFVLIQNFLVKALPNHSHKKRKESLETWAVLLIFWLELEISWVARFAENRSKQ